MFVKPEMMPHQIKITNIRMEHLQDISNSDCIKEGIEPSIRKGYRLPWGEFKTIKRPYAFCYPSLRKAYAALIDKISGKGTWDSNPWVWVFEFELIK